MLKRVFLLSTLAVLSGCGDDPARESVAALLPDPSSARFQAVEDRGDHVCGEVNGTNEAGTYKGYRRFIYDESTGVALIDGDIEAEGPRLEPADPACEKREAYKSVAERLSCARAPELEQARERQRVFEELWERLCG